MKPSGTHLFQQVFDYVIHRIESGEWKAHDKLPSVRNMAEKMKVHRLTVLKAYQLLTDQKKVYVKDRSGYFVRPEGLQTIDPSDNPIVSSFLYKNHLSEIHQMKVDYQFSRALINPNLLPNHFFADFLKDVLLKEPEMIGTYSSLEGDLELREKLAAFFAEQSNVHVSSDELLICSGSQPMISLVAQTFLKRGDLILLERPSYSMAIDVFLREGVQIETVDISPTGYDMEEIEEKMKQLRPKIFYINPTFQNPTGYTVPAKQRKQLVELAERYRCLILEDDTQYDMYFEQKPPAPVFAYDTEGYVIYLRSYSKYICPGLRIAVAACRYPLMKHLKSAKSLADNGAPLVNQKMFLPYFFSKRMQLHMEKLRIALAIRKELMEAELSHSNWSWQSPNGGLSLWIQLPDRVPVDKLLSLALKNSISFVPGEIFDPLKENRSWIRLSYSFVSESEIQSGVRKLLELARKIET